MQDVGKRVVVTVTEAARIACVSHQTIRNLVFAGRLKACTASGEPLVKDGRRGPKGVRVLVSSLAALLTPPPAPVKPPPPVPVEQEPQPARPKPARKRRHGARRSFEEIVVIARSRTTPSPPASAGVAP